VCGARAGGAQLPLGGGPVGEAPAGAGEGGGGRGYSGTGKGDGTITDIGFLFLETKCTLLQSCLWVGALWVKHLLAQERAGADEATVGQVRGEGTSGSLFIDQI